MQRISRHSKTVEKVVGEVHDEKVVEDGSNAVDNHSVEEDIGDDLDRQILSLYQFTWLITLKNTQSQVAMI